MLKFVTPSRIERAVDAVMAVTLKDESPDSIGSLLSRRMGNLVVVGPIQEPVDVRSNNEFLEALQTPNLPGYLYYELAFGNPAEWPHDFQAISRSKVLQVCQGRHDSGTDALPHMLFPGDTPYWAAVKRYGLVVGFSGVQPYFDRMIAGMVLEMIVALAYDAWMKSETKEQGLNFIP